MPKLPKISDAEWQVMDVLWAARAPLTANDVVETLTGRCDWSPATVKTLLNRLAAKGALRHKADGKRYLYSPAVTRDACVRRETRGLLDRLFGGAAGAMLAHFVEESKLTKDEVEQLRRLLDKKAR